MFLLAGVIKLLQFDASVGSAGPLGRRSKRKAGV